MKEEYRRRDSCRLCNSKNIELVMKLAPTPPGDAYVSLEGLSFPQKLYPLDLFFCNDCTLAQIVDVVNPTELYKKYIYNTSISLGSPEHFEKYASEVCDFVKPEKNSLVIDIGSNDGTLLKNFKNHRLNVLGIDPAGEIARKATENGIKTIPDFFTPELSRRILEEYGPAKIVTANNITANIDDLNELMIGVKTILSKDGTYVFDTGYVVDLVKKDLIDVIYHEHISFFSVNSLEPFFMKHGMRFVDAKNVPIKRGSLRGLVQYILPNQNISSSVREMKDLERESGVLDSRAFFDFDERMNRTKESLQGIVKNIKSQNKTLAGYGASIGVTTMIYHFGLGSSLDFLVDDNPVRHGSYSPGYHIPVVSRKLLKEKSPDYTIILAWQYRNQIIKNNQEYLNRGGKFIIPLPKIEILE